MFSLTVLGFPPYFLACIAFCFGAIIGSFLNVVIYRLHTGKSLAGRSHCMSCGTPLSWYHLFPLVSYLGLRGRCGHCSASFTPRYFLVEFLTAGLFALVVLTFTDLVEIGVLLVAVSLLVVVLVYDIRHMIIPDEYVLALSGVALVREVYMGVTGGVWQAGVMNGFAALLAAAFFFSLWYFSKGRWIGFGDVKLVLPLGLLVGSAGVFSMVVLSFWIGAIISVGLLLLQKLGGGGKPALRFLGIPLTMKSAVPFAPFLIAGCLVVLLWQVDVLRFFFYDFSY